MMLVIFFILTRTVSLTLHTTMDVTVHNRYPDIELVSPICFYNHEKRYECLIEKTGVGTMMKTSFRIEMNELSGGILAYKVQRKGNTKSDCQPNTDTTSTEAIEDASKIMRLLVTWKENDSRDLIIRMLLVEHDNELVLNEDKLEQLYNKVNDIPSELYNWILKYDDDDGIYKSTWLMCDNTVLKAACELIYEKGRELKVIISEGVRNLDDMKPLWVDSTRQVSYLMI
jgi:hypothetical protein